MTGIYYFERYLTEDEQYKFKEEVFNQLTEAYLWQYLDKDFESFLQFLSSAFMWDRSKEGFYYWDLISNRKSFEYNMSRTIMQFIEEEFYDYSQERLDELSASAIAFVRDKVSPINFY
jgi:hypothetical protein